MPQHAVISSCVPQHVLCPCQATQQLDTERGRRIEMEREFQGLSIAMSRIMAILIGNGIAPPARESDSSD